MENESQQPLGVMTSEIAKKVEMSASSTISPRPSSMTLPNTLWPKRANAELHEPSPRQRPQFADDSNLPAIDHDSHHSRTPHGSSQVRVSQSHLHGHLHSPVLSRPRAKGSILPRPTPTTTDSDSAMPARKTPPSSHPATTLTQSSAATSRQRSASPSKRSPKVLPQSFFNCDLQDLLLLISSMLSELIKLNDALPLVSSQLTRFHSRAPPLISHRDYLHRLTRFCSLEKSTLLSMVFYIDLLCAALSSFTINSLTVHRFLITAATVASKGLCDSFCTNAHYARVGGVSLTELNLLEVEFLVRVGWRVVPSVKTLDEYYRRMVARMGSVYVLQESEPERPPDIRSDEDNQQ
ncbi:cyclin-domain-containing protein [Lipomyces tetrasporus]